MGQRHSGDGPATCVGVLRVAGLALPAVVALLLGGCTGSDGRHLSFLDPQGPIAAAQRFHFFEVIGLLLIVVLPVLVLVPWFAWRYRLRNRKSRYTPKWGFSIWFECVVWGVPIAIAVALAVLLLRSTAALDPYRALDTDHPALRVQVIGYDWKWLFVYPDLGIASVGEVAFPAGQPLALELTSASVMQSFWIAPLGSQIYAMGGMVTQLHLQADRPGRFAGENTQYNGQGFHEQKFTAVALPPSDFDGWVARVRQNGVALDAPAYRTLSERSTSSELRAALSVPAEVPAGVVYFSGVAPGLFHRVVQATMQGTPVATSAAGAQTKTGPGSGVSHAMAADICGQPPSKGEQ